MVLYLLGPVLNTGEDKGIQHIIADIVTRAIPGPLSVPAASEVTKGAADGFVCSKAHRPTTIGTLDKPGKNLSCLVLHGATADGGLFLYPVKHLTTYKRVMGVFNAYPLAGRLADCFLALERNVALLVVYAVTDVGFIMQNTLDLGNSPGVPLTLRLILEDKVGIYCRLSVDDASNSAKAKNYIPGDESASIENQHEILSKFVMLNGWIEVKTYRDDGYSGGNFQRPGFLEMLEDARHGLINLILVKDLSRLGRDFVEVGRYTDVIFPSLGCRFVSVLDCLDSEGDNTDMLHFRSLMNDYHLKDLSGKIKSVLYAKKKSGQYLTAYAPYGYRKSDEDKHRLVVDEEAAAVVQEIYRMRCSGMAYGKIAAALNKKGILSPRWHWELHYGKKGSCKYSKLWACATVKNILNDAVYLGIVTQNRTGSRSYKDKTMIQKPETEWICHEDAHEAIVDREVWEAVQEKNRAVKQQVANHAAPLPALFTGKLVCADCGHPLVATRETRRRKNGTAKRYVSYICSHFSTTGHSACSWHRIYEISLKTLVLNEIRAHSQAVAQDENAVLDKLKQQILSESAAKQEDSKLEISRLRRRIGELEHMTAKLYEDKVSGAINGDTFAVLIQKSEQERIQKADRLDALLSEERKARQEVENIRQWAGIVRRYLDVQELDREIVEELIDHIEIGERSIIDGQRHQDIKIFYRFVGVV